MKKIITFLLTAAIMLGTAGCMAGRNNGVNDDINRNGVYDNGVNDNGVLNGGVTGNTYNNTRNNGVLDNDRDDNDRLRDNNLNGGVGAYDNTPNDTMFGNTPGNAINDLS